jgi:hypothetical protein
MTDSRIFLRDRVTPEAPYKIKKRKRFIRKIIPSTMILVCSQKQKVYALR